MPRQTDDRILIAPGQYEAVVVGHTAVGYVRMNFKDPASGLWKQVFYKPKTRAEMDATQLGKKFLIRIEVEETT